MVPLSTTYTPVSKLAITIVDGMYCNAPLAEIGVLYTGRVAMSSIIL